MLLNIAVIVYLAIREFGGETPARFTGELRIVYLLPAVGCFLAMLVSEAWKYAMLLRRAGHKHAVRMGLDCAVIGKYFDNVTPAGFGGQPFQIYYLNKHGCSDGVSGSLPILGFLGLQLSFVLLALAVRLFGDTCLPDSVTLRLAAWIGIALYAFFPLCILLFAVAPGPLERIVHRGTKALGRLHIIKQPDESAARAIDSLRAYTGYLKSYRKQPFLLFQALLLSMVFRLAMVIMPWFVLRAFGADIGFMSCVCQVTFIYAAVTVIPTPGNSGVAEASFYAVFSSLAPGSVFWAVLVWRLLSYYSWLLSGAGYFIAEGLRRRYFAKRRARRPEYRRAVHRCVLSPCGRLRGGGKQRRHGGSDRAHFPRGCRRSCRKARAGNDPHPLERDRAPCAQGIRGPCRGRETEEITAYEI